MSESFKTYTGLETVSLQPTISVTIRVILYSPSGDIISYMCDGFFSFEKDPSPKSQDQSIISVSGEDVFNNWV
mgnify:CR=1 FL=1